MIRWIWTLVMTLMPSLLWAQTIPVRAGEHDGFTRLVFDIPAGTDWALQQATDRLRLSLDLTDGAFDTAGTFDRITRQRVEDLVALSNGSDIDILLACDCVADAFVLRGQMLVVDVKAFDGRARTTLGTALETREPDLTAPTQEPLIAFDRVENPTPTRTLRQPTVSAETTPPPMPADQVPEVPAPPLFESESALRIGPEQVDNPLLPGFQVGSMFEPSMQPPEETAPGELNANAFSEALIKNLARAATQGVLDPSLNSVDGITSMVQSIDQAATPSPSPAEDDTAEDEAVASLQDALETLSQGGPRDARISVGATGCIPNSAIDVRSWADPAAGFEALQRARGEIYSEFGGLEAQPALKLAKGFLYYGFGAETRVILDLLPEDPPYLRSLSYIVDGGYDPAQSFTGQTACETNAALWAVLSPRRLPDEVLIDTQAVLRAFEELPPPLRSALGNEVSERLSLAGYDATARDILRRLERMYGSVTPAMELASVQMALRAGDLEGAGAALRTLAETPGPESMAAVVAAIDLAWQTGQALPPHIAELAEAFGKEYQNSEEGGELWQARIRARLLDGQAEEAVDLFQVDLNQSAELLQKTGDELVRGVTERASDVSFLKLAASNLLPRDSLSKHDLALPFIDRLMKLNMPELALQQLDLVPVSMRDEQTSLIRAQALLDVGEPEQAEQVLAPFDTEAALRLMAQSYETRGEFPAAQLIYDQLGDAENAQQAAFLSSNWEAVRAGTGTLAETAEVIQAETAVPAGSDFTLGALEDLSRDAEQTRSVIEALLSETALTPE